MIEQREIAESDWWREAIAGRNPRVVNEFPQAGYFKRRLIRGGVFVPARIWLVEHFDPATGDLMADTEYHCEVNGEPRDAFEQWSYLASNPISFAEYRFMVDDAKFVREYAPNDPKATPAAAVDFLTAPIPF